MGAPFEELQGSPWEKSHWELVFLGKNLLGRVMGALWEGLTSFPWGNLLGEGFSLGKTSLGGPWEHLGRTLGGIFVGGNLLGRPWGHLGRALGVLLGRNLLGKGFP